MSNEAEFTQVRRPFFRLADESPTELIPSMHSVCAKVVAASISPILMSDRYGRHLRLADAALVAIAFAMQCNPVFAQGDETPESVEVQDADISAGPPQPAQKVDVVPHVADDDIRSRIEKILLASKWFESVEVQVNEGIVFLEGQATEQKHREWAADTCCNVRDVVAVVNNISTGHKSSFDLQRESSHVASSLQTLWRDFLES